MKLKYQEAKGERLGDFEICYKNENLGDEWQRVYNILRTNNATIKNSFQRIFGPTGTGSTRKIVTDFIARKKLRNGE